MKAVILAGGLGTRISEETETKPKPMVEIGGKPILWHLMKIYSAHGIREFIVCLGYKGYLIKEYFTHYLLHTSDITCELEKERVHIHEGRSEPWSVTLAETGNETMTGGRLKRVGKYLENEDFCFTYGDGVGDIDITRLVSFHREQKTLATVTAVKPPARFGALQLRGTKVESFQEKPQGESGWINGGFFVLSPRVIDYISGDDTVWERGPMERLAKEGNLAAFCHEGFWHPVDTLRDKKYLEGLWASGKAPWRIEK